MLFVFSCGSAEIGSRGRIRNSTADALDVVSLLLDYASCAVHANDRWQIAHSQYVKRLVIGYWLSAIAPKAPASSRCCPGTISLQKKSAGCCMEARWPAC